MERLAASPRKGTRLLTLSDGCRRVLLVHEYYQLPGGEDEIFESTRDLLLANGHEVFEHVRDNDEIAGFSSLQKPRLGLGTVWSLRAKRDFARVVQQTRPDIIQMFNTFPLLSPSLYSACQAARVPV